MKNPNLLKSIGLIINSVLLFFIFDFFLGLFTQSDLLPFNYKVVALLNNSPSIIGALFLMYGYLKMKIPKIGENNNDNKILDDFLIKTKETKNRQYLITGFKSFGLIFILLGFISFISALNSGFLNLEAIFFSTAQILNGVIALLYIKK